MADKKISLLNNMAALVGTEKLTGLQAGTNLNATPAQIQTHTYKDIFRTTQLGYVGSNSMGTGLESLLLATVGQQDNVAYGDYSLASITGAVQCCAFGKDALRFNIGSYNYAFGKGAIQENIGGTRNSGFGKYAQRNGTSASFNCSFGQETLNNNLVGIENTIFGYFSGRSILGSGNVMMGFQAGMNETGSNKFYLHNSSTSTPLIYAEFDTGFARINGDLDITGVLSLKVESSDPAGLANGDVWIKDTGGVRTLNARMGGVTYSTTLT